MLWYFSYIYLLKTAIEKYTIETALPMIKYGYSYTVVIHVILVATKANSDTITKDHNIFVCLFSNKFLNSNNENIVGINHKNEAPIFALNKYSLPEI